MLTIKQHLQTLPEPHRSQALRNMFWERKDDPAPTKARALWNAFTWTGSPEKTIYWAEFYLTILEPGEQDPK